MMFSLSNVVGMTQASKGSRSQFMYRSHSVHGPSLSSMSERQKRVHHLSKQLQTTLRNTGKIPCPEDRSKLLRSDGHKQRTDSTSRPPDNAKSSQLDSDQQT